jgi:hypothetical protein
MHSISTLLIALLAASASASALPRGAGQHHSSSTDSTSSTPTATIIPSPPLSTDIVPELISKMKTAGTVVDRFNTLLLDSNKNLLTGDDLRSRTVFDFNAGNVPAKGATGGAIALANINKFPILTGLGVSVALGFISGCGLNTPHTHPRATEFLTVVEGEMHTGFILENGFVDADGKPIEVTATLGKNQGTVFPVGSNHWQFNPSCDNATFVAALSSEDPGVSQIAQNFFNLEGDVIEATLGFPESIDGKNLKDFKAQIPANVAQIVENCAAKCGYKF